MSKEEAIHELYKICKDINFDEADDILLLTRTQTNSVNRELYSYVLFLKAKGKGLMG